MGFQEGSIRRNSDPIQVEWLGQVDYADTWQRQAQMAAEIADGTRPDTVLLLEHPPTYTAGKRTEDSDRPTNGLPVVDVDRGGRITWHGPGQLVAYPLIKLADPVDVVDYVRRMEEALIATCRDFGVNNVGRVEGRSGVWLPAGVVDGQLLPARKIAAIGIRVTRGVTMHGVSLNCDNTLEYYDHIVPCGLSDAGVATLSRELGRDIRVSDAEPHLRQHIIDALNGDLHVEKHELPEQ
ncbi:lipoyl(octanoyl) transferase LipB [Corynebacterium sp. 320]|uniref:Octanoyltransferase n=1 Tax=Corynebacterium zhongnanshanii TaxID=2768834 RepID=A0ABQ6VD55_9CORY|nr:MULTISPECIES: lipoyl(octanoyl) transferase LipB [Corynebacterium]KAB1502465.1 lipoyl(octanoyl) transferase LipB [Corynebacterium sp. 320]KAB1551314.1 lipoyl(octanoyl) transferase LipB [Corynebacterium sp. 321]KAB1551858.1 lipoyl(octanoyl) transferase LipB [Corynebacterium sp. 319]KAB3520853.1 lipoyl(octanoyl) transferase LipB [Corynebacterium zhongnanshanii]KAB3526072.1 lipoyl(octanoyl) transferase LipB [Corynebacterium sp. 250]